MVVVELGVRGNGERLFGFGLVVGMSISLEVSVWAWFVWVMLDRGFEVHVLELGCVV